MERYSPYHKFNMHVNQSKAQLISKEGWVYSTMLSPHCEALQFLEGPSYNRNNPQVFPTSF